MIHKFHKSSNLATTKLVVQLSVFFLSFGVGISRVGGVWTGSTDHENGGGGWDSDSTEDHQYHHQPHLNAAAGNEDQSRHYEPSSSYYPSGSGGWLDGAGSYRCYHSEECYRTCFASRYEPDRCPHYCRFLPRLCSSSRPHCPNCATLPKPTTTPQPIPNADAVLPKCQTDEIDKARVALTLEDAVKYFPDLTDEEAGINIAAAQAGSSENRQYPSSATGGGMSMSEDEACQMKMMQKLTEMGMIDEEEMRDAMDSMALSNLDMYGDYPCTRYRWAREEVQTNQDPNNSCPNRQTPLINRYISRLQKYSFTETQAIRDNIRGLSNNSDKSDDSDDDDDDDEGDNDDSSDVSSYDFYVPGIYKNRRRKRQVKTPPDGLGQRYIVNCLKRGETDSSTGSQWMVTCNMCWAWRRLPAGSTPQYLNELVCDTDSTNSERCLSGYGKCRQRTMRIQGKASSGTTMQLDAASCCDCKLPPGSALSSFVTG